MKAVPWTRRNRRRLPLGMRKRAGWCALLLVPLAGSFYSFGSRPASPSASPTARLAAAASAAPAEEQRVTPEKMRALQAKLRELVEDAPARAAAVYVQDIDSGLTAGANPNRHFLAASLMKLQIMGATYEKWEERPELRTPAARWWVEQMITVSDNRSTDRLVDLVGGPDVVYDFCRERGWPNLKLTHKIYNWGGRRGPNLCTAREVVELLVALDRRELVSPEADQQMWEVLCRQKKRARIPAGLPDVPGLEVGSKTGTLSNALHDAGIIHTPRARYALCILLSGQRGEGSGNQFCRRVSRLVFDTLHGSAGEGEDSDAVIAAR